MAISRGCKGGLLFAFIVLTVTGFGMTMYAYLSPIEEPKAFYGTDSYSGCSFCRNADEEKIRSTERENDTKQALRIAGPVILGIGIVAVGCLCVFGKNSSNGQPSVQYHNGGKSQGKNFPPQNHQQGNPNNVQYGGPRATPSVINQNTTNFYPRPPPPPNNQYTQHRQHANQYLGMTTAPQMMQHQQHANQYPGMTTAPQMMQHQQHANQYPGMTTAPQMMQHQQHANQYPGMTTAPQMMQHQQHANQYPGMTTAPQMMQHQQHANQYPGMTTAPQMMQHQQHANQYPGMTTAPQMMQHQQHANQYPGMTTAPQMMQHQQQHHAKQYPGMIKAPKMRHHRQKPNFDRNPSFDDEEMMEDNFAQLDHEQSVFNNHCDIATTNPSFQHEGMMGENFAQLNHEGQIDIATADPSFQQQQSDFDMSNQYTFDPATEQGN